MALSQVVQKQINDIRGQFPTTQALMLPVLHAVQDEQGWVSPESMVDIAAFLEMPLNKVQEVASFYTMYQKEKIGKVNLQFCVNISCWLNGAEKLVHCAEKRLGIKCGETTKDGKFTISEAECLAACGTAPAMMINEDYFESLDVPQLNTLLDQANKDLDAGKEVGKSTQTPGVWP